MKLKRCLPHYGAALALFLGRGAQADTIIDFDVLPPGFGSNATIPQFFGDTAGVSSDGVTVSGFGTPNIGLTWQGSGASWQFYLDSVWAAGQLDSSDPGDRHEVLFAPNVPNAAAVIKSFNFHPYYVDPTERYTYNVSVLAGAAVVSGPTTYSFLCDSAKHLVSINYTGAVGQTLTLRIDRITSPSENEGGRGDIAVDDITFAQSPETEFPVGPQVVTVTPANGQTGAAPDHNYLARITNGVTSLVSGTIQLRFNGSVVSPTISEADGMTNVSYQAVALLAAGSTNRYTLTYDDNSVPAKHFTNEVQYVVANYVDIKLPEPIAFENFNSTAEGSVPAGWTVTNLDTIRDATSEPDITFTNLDSAAYTNWTVVEAYHFTNTFDTYSQLYNALAQPLGEAEDYQRVLSVNPSNVVNGVFLRSLATGRFAFGNSGYRNDALGQVVYLFSPDFNLTGQANVYLSFHSLHEQNQDSIASVEYSINGGATWLPVVYMIDGADIATNLDGTINALATLTNIQPAGFQGTAHYVDSLGNTNGGYYGAFIGVDSNQWSTLAPYISRRVDDNPVESKRIEIFRLPQADNQATVRLRFGYAGTDSWYLGIDDVGLYSLAPLRITSIARTGANVTISWNGAAGTKLQKTTNLANPNWQDVAGSNGASNAVEPASGAAFYRLSRPY